MFMNTMKAPPRRTFRSFSPFHSSFVRFRSFPLLGALLSAGLLVTVFSACGGSSGVKEIDGGGGKDDEFVGAARLALSRSPSVIDTGDRTRVAVRITRMETDGILLKVRYPKGLRYVQDTAELSISDRFNDANGSGDEVEFPPAINVQQSNRVFLVFFINADSLDEDGSGTLRFQLVGDSSIRNGRIEVDADVNDTLIPDEQEFDPENPQFEAEQSVSITVED